MRSILALSLLISLAGAANAATVHHSHRSHVVVRPASDPAWSSAYAQSAPPIHYGPAPDQGQSEPYFGASQGYAPGEKERFLHSVFSP